MGNIKVILWKLLYNQPSTTIKSTEISVVSRVHASAWKWDGTQ